MSSRHCGLSPRWQVRCSDGFQPPEIARPSHAILLARTFGVDDLHCAKRPRAPRLNDLRSKENARRSRQRVDETFRRIGARIDDGLNQHAGTNCIGCGAPAAVIVREHDETGGRHGRKSVEISPRSAGEHYAGSIIAGEGDRPFARAGGEHRPLGDDLPQALARLVRRWLGKMIAHAFHRTVLPVIVHAEHACAAHDPDFGHRPEFGFDRRSPTCAFDDRRGQNAPPAGARQAGNLPRRESPAPQPARPSMPPSGRPDLSR